MDPTVLINEWVKKTRGNRALMSEPELSMSARVALTVCQTYGLPPRAHLPVMDAFMKRGVATARKALRRMGAASAGDKDALMREFLTTVSPESVRFWEETKVKESDPQPQLEVDEEEELGEEDLEEGEDEPEVVSDADRILSGDLVIKRGGKKKRKVVETVQDALADMGLMEKMVGRRERYHGVFTGATEKALKEFQKAEGLEVTGEIDKSTLEQLV